MKNILLTTTLALSAGVLMAQTPPPAAASSATPAAQAPISQVSPAVPASPPPASTKIYYPRYQAELSVPLISMEDRAKAQRMYRSPTVADMVCRGRALDQYIFDGLRLVRTYGKVEGRGRHHHEPSARDLAREYRITPEEAAAWIEASRVFHGRYADPVDVVQQDLLPQASMRYDQLLGYLPPYEVARIMPGTAAYRNPAPMPTPVPAAPSAAPVVPAPQTVIVAPPPPVYVQPVPMVPAPVMGVGVDVWGGGGRRW